MNKKILLACIMMLAAVLIFASCNKKEKEPSASTTESTASTTQVLEYSTEENGNTFVTNKKGEKIPVTTNKDGGIELAEDLITKTAEQVSREQQIIESQKTTTTQKVKTTASSGVISIGGDDPIIDEGNAAVIDWR